MIRPTVSIVILAALLAAVAACAPATGSLGTPATPVASPARTGEIPSDELPTGEIPSDGLPSTGPTTAPATSVASPTLAPGGSLAPTDVPATQEPTPSATPTPAPSGTTVVRAYFLMRGGEGSSQGDGSGGLVPVLREMPKTSAVARAAVEALLAGPSGAEAAWDPPITSDVPEDTRLLDLSIKDRVASVDLSREWKAATASFRSGTATAQLVYTLTQFPTVDSVRILVDGVPQGGAQARTDFRVEGIIPAIFVDRPAWGGSLGNPGRVSGLANVFEATFRVQLLDAAGNTLADEQVMASCGTGCWGRFSKDLTYDVGTAQYGTLRVYNLSARDGSPENVSEYKVWLTPAG